ncbi:hypothetical protein CRENBAI_006476 [Crenichthys baileyi]|uniref:Uncharacterized protein n=1 Tax=Crenichthys baileyi TaxID=28760 RepID=A0AAV9RGA2_9TELE
MDETEKMEQEFLVLTKRRSKRKNIVTAVQASKQANKLVAQRKEVSDSSDSESWFSDTSKLSVFANEQQRTEISDRAISDILTTNASYQIWILLKISSFNVNGKL